MHMRMAATDSILSHNYANKEQHYSKFENKKHFSRSRISLCREYGLDLLYTQEKWCGAETVSGKLEY